MQGDTLPVKPGDLVEIEGWEHSALVEKIEQKGNYIALLVRLEGEDSPKWEGLRMSQSEFHERVRRVIRWWERPKEAMIPWEQFVLYIEAQRMRRAYLYDPHYATRASHVDLLPHQVESVYHHFLPQYQIRALLADDPGLGKTIQAGLILKELYARGAISHVLLIVPSHLIEQWQKELSYRFALSFQLLQSANLADSLGLQKLLEQPERFLIVSMDTAKRENMLNFLKAQSWDMIIVDEAHRLHATQQGQKLRKTQRYKLMEELAPKAEHILFLTGTPHSGRRDAYEALLRLLIPYFQEEQEISVREAREKGIFVIVRRSKKDAIDLNGEPLFPPRKSYYVTLKVDNNPTYKKLYQEVTDYVRKWYPDSLRKLRKLNDDLFISYLRYFLDLEKESYSEDNRSSSDPKADFKARGVALALMILQRRVSSSMLAIYNSLSRRLEKLEALMGKLKDSSPSEKEIKDYLYEHLDIPDDTYEELASITSARNEEELKEEVDTLRILLRQAEKMKQEEQSPKLLELKNICQKILDEKSNKIVIFTEFRDTQREIVEALRSWNIESVTIHGQMKSEERLAAVEQFRSGVPVLVATDAAGEGINLQFCNILINYDLPWNPMRLEQRIGRIHRYGQTKTCFIYHFIYEDTVEGKVLSYVLRKLETIREDLKDSLAYDDLIGTQIENLVEEFVIQGEVSQYQVEKKIDEILQQERLETIRRDLEEMGLEAAKHIDLSPILRNEQGAQLRRLIPWDTHRFIALATKHLGGRLSHPPQSIKDRNSKLKFYILQLPQHARRQLEIDKVFMEESIKVIFNKKSNIQRDARFLVPEDEIFDAYLRYFCKKSGEVFTVLMDPYDRRGLLWIYLLQARNQANIFLREEIILLFHNFDTNQVHFLSDRALWDFEPIPSEASFQIESDFERRFREWQEVSEKAIESELDRIKSTVESEQNRRLSKIIQWVEQSYEKILAAKRRQKAWYQERQQRGEDMKITIRGISVEIEKIERRRKEISSRIQKSKIVDLLWPKVLAVAYVQPKSYYVQNHLTHQQVMKKAIDEVKRLVLQKEGVSSREVNFEYAGYNLVIQQNSIKRYGLVKSVIDNNPLIFTSNEWQVFNRLNKDLLLWVVHFDSELKVQDIYQLDGEQNLDDINNKVEPFDKIELSSWKTKFQWKKLL